MFTIKIVESTEGVTIEKLYSCTAIERNLNKNEGDEGKDLTHYLTLYNSFGDQKEIDLSSKIEDKHGVYSRDVYIMNENGKTIDRL